MFCSTHQKLALLDARKRGLDVVTFDNEREVIHSLMGSIPVEEIRSLLEEREQWEIEEAEATP